MNSATRRWPLASQTSPTPQGFGYAVFGKVVQGMDVVDKIRKIPTGPGGPFPKDVPQAPVVIEQAMVIEPGQSNK